MQQTTIPKPKEFGEEEKTSIWTADYVKWRVSRIHTRVAHKIAHQTENTQWKESGFLMNSKLTLLTKNVALKRKGRHASEDEKKGKPNLCKLHLTDLSTKPKKHVYTVISVILYLSLLADSTRPMSFILIWRTEDNALVSSVFTSIWAAFCQGPTLQDIVIKRAIALTIAAAIVRPKSLALIEKLKNRWKEGIYLKC